MSRLEQMIKELCPEGVEYVKIGDIATVNRGVRVTKNQLSGTGTIPVYQNSMTPLGYYDKSNCSANTAFVIGAGAAGEIGYCPTEFWAADDCYYFICNDNLNSKFLYYCLMKNEDKISSKVRKASIPRISRSVIENIVIPLPPLEIQAEIVRILDEYSTQVDELNNLLKSELEARKKQYEYYRDKLLDFGTAENERGGVTWKTLGEISKYRRGSFPQPYGRKEWYDGEGSMPFVQVADILDNMSLSADTNRKISVKAQPKSVFAPKGSIIISLQGSIGRIAITQYDAYIDRTIAIFYDISNEVISKYFVYQLQRIFSIKEKTARGSTIKTITKEEFTSFLIPIPPLSEQERIVAILDRFDKLCNDISEGLPAEIEARKKQYEYYRDRLMSFKER